MTNNEILLLDTDILVSFPQILEINHSFYKLATTAHVIQDIKSGYNIAIKNKIKQRLLQKIDSLKKAGTLIVYSSDIESHFTFGTKKLSSSETSLLDIAANLKEADNIVIGSMNENITIAAKSLKVKTYDLDTIIGIYARQNGKNMEEIKMSLSYIRKDLISVRNKVVVGLLALFITILGYKYRELIISNLNVAGTIVMTTVFAILLFIFRERQRISYGILEFGVSLTSIILIFHPSFHLANVSFDFAFGIKYIGGIYIMIRGLDNVVKGLSKTSTGQVLRYKYKIGL
jgi:hypothetical protein